MWQKLIKFEYFDYFEHFQVGLNKSFPFLEYEVGCCWHHCRCNDHCWHRYRWRGSDEDWHTSKPSWILLEMMERGRRRGWDWCRSYCRPEYGRQSETNKINCLIRFFICLSPPICLFYGGILDIEIKRCQICVVTSFLMDGKSFSWWETNVYVFTTLSS